MPRKTFRYVYSLTQRDIDASIRAAKRAQRPTELGSSAPKYNPKPPKSKKRKISKELTSSDKGGAFGRDMSASRSKPSKPKPSPKGKAPGKAPRGRGRR